MYQRSSGGNFTEVYAVGVLKLVYALSAKRRDGKAIEIWLKRAETDEKEVR